MKSLLPKPDYQGKVRDIYFVNDSMLILASDRISAFDYVFPNTIDGKGKILTSISNHWFSLIKQIKGNRVKTHLIETDFQKYPVPFSGNEALAERSVLVQKAERINFECVARGYLLGSGHQEYTNSGMVCGVRLPDGIALGQRLDSPIFTPSTKSDKGHDENISFENMTAATGQELAVLLRKTSLELYAWGREKLAEKGILLLDTKFEFGLVEGELTLIDEVFTPDSSRFCREVEYKRAMSKGGIPLSMDKQILREYLQKIEWNKEPPIPSLPGFILKELKNTYLEIEKIILSIQN